MAKTLMMRGARRAAAREAFRALKTDAQQGRAYRTSFNQFWQFRNDDDQNDRYEHQLKQGRRHKVAAALKGANQCASHTQMVRASYSRRGSHGHSQVS
jgi:hypothetical protein